MKAFARLIAPAAVALGVALGGAMSARAADKAVTFPIDQVMGKADAPITIIEYASPTCGHCANFHKTVLPKLKAEWLDTGKARLIYRDFPTAPAQMAVAVSMIPHCAGPERYFGVLGLIMDGQDKWMNADNPLDTLKKMVRIAGMTGEDVDACLQREDLATAIQDRAKQANDVNGIDATPSFLVDGKLMVGARSYEEFDAALKAAQKK